MMGPNGRTIKTMYRREKTQALYILFKNIYEVATAFKIKNFQEKAGLLFKEFQTWQEIWKKPIDMK